jgi:hypothetical protein
MINFSLHDFLCCKFCEKIFETSKSKYRTKTFVDCTLAVVDFFPLIQSTETLIFTHFLISLSLFLLFFFHANFNYDTSIKNTISDNFSNEIFSLFRQNFNLQKLLEACITVKVNRNLEEKFCFSRWSSSFRVFLSFYCFVELAKFFQIDLSFH